MRMCTMTTRGAGNEVSVFAPFRPTIYQKKEGEKKKERVADGHRERWSERVTVREEGREPKRWSERWI